MRVMRNEVLLLVLCDSKDFIACRKLKQWQSLPEYFISLMSEFVHISQYSMLKYINSHAGEVSAYSKRDTASYSDGQGFFFPDGVPEDASAAYRGWRLTRTQETLENHSLSRRLSTYRHRWSKPTLLAWELVYLVFFRLQPILQPTSLRSPSQARSRHTSATTMAPTASQRSRRKKVSFNSLASHR